jgi:regulation of enolase protein 1 (concanavalin A-like superfamily)
VAAALCLVAALPAAAAAQTWAEADIGAPQVAGSVRSGTGQYASLHLLTGAGAGASGRSDQLHFVYLPISTDADFSACVEATNGPDPGLSVGLMLRESLDARARTAAVLFSPARGVALHARATAGALPVVGSYDAGAAPLCLRLIRRGTTIDAYSSSNRTTWTAVGRSTVAMPASALLGLALSSNGSAVKAQALVSSMKLSLPADDPNLPPGDGGPLPAPWVGDDVGAPASAGVDTFDGQTFSVTGAGQQIGATSDQFHYVYQQIAGDTDMTVRVDSVSAADPLAGAGLMVRASLQPGAAYAFAGATAGKTVVFSRRVSSGAAATETRPANLKSPGWVRLARRGNVLTASWSSDGVAWTTIGTQAISMPSTVYAGMAVASRNPSLAATALFSRVTLSSQGGKPANKPPAVSITSPSALAQLPSGTVPISVAASDPDGTVVRVDFYAGDALIGSSSSAPFTFTWQATTSGTYALRASAVDNAGASSTSAQVQVQIVAAAPQRASITLSFDPSPDHATLVTGYLLEIRKGGAPVSAAPLVSASLGKPAVVKGTISVNIDSWLAGLSSGAYYVVVKAVGTAGTSSGAASGTFTL